MKLYPPVDVGSQSIKMYLPQTGFPECEFDQYVIENIYINSNPYAGPDITIHDDGSNYYLNVA